jgi:Polyketide cyclase / dehydrase and lipid transport
MARIPSQVATRRADVAHLLVADVHGAGFRAPGLADVPGACATAIIARGFPQHAARHCESAAHPRGVSRTAAVPGASSLPPHIERGSGRRTGRARHGRDTLPLDNPDHKRDNGWKSLVSPQAMSPRATWRALMTVHGMHREASIEIQASPEAVYDLVSDLSRMGEWSPENIGGEWQGGSGKVGDRFLGHNRTRERAWSVPVMVTVAERGRCFEFVTHPDDGPYVRWTYRLEPSGSGTRVTEIWNVEQLSPGRRGQTQAQLDERSRYTEGMLATTLAALKATAEG